MSKAICFIALQIGTGAFLFSQSITTDTIAIEEVVVTGTKMEVARKNVPLTVSLVPRETLDQTTESALLPVLSEEIPGLFVTERGITGFGVATGAAGQLNMYLNYYENEVNDEVDNKPIGIILCTDKDALTAEYALGGLSNNIFASKYTYYIPEKEQLIAEVEKIIAKLEK